MVLNSYIKRQKDIEGRNKQGETRSPEFEEAPTSNWLAKNDNCQIVTDSKKIKDSNIKNNIYLILFIKFIHCPFCDLSQL